MGQLQDLHIADLAAQKTAGSDRRCYRPGSAMRALLQRRLSLLNGDRH
jgi:hypothetical protein